MNESPRSETARGAAMPVIEVSDLAKTYPDGAEALRGISFNVAEGLRLPGALRFRFTSSAQPPINHLPNWMRVAMRVLLNRIHRSASPDQCRFINDRRRQGDTTPNAAARLTFGQEVLLWPSTRSASTKSL